MTTLRLSVVALTLMAVGATVALLMPKRCAGHRAEVLAQNQDMVSEGGPAGPYHD